MYYATPTLGKVNKKALSRRAKFASELVSFLNNGPEKRAVHF